MKRKRRVGNRTGDSGRFAISFAGWIGIGLIVLGVAYFVLLPAKPENAAERKPSPPEATGEATLPLHRLQEDLRAPGAVEPASVKRGDALPATDHGLSR
jgi:hypothetical protein